MPNPLRHTILSTLLLASIIAAPPPVDAQADPATIPRDLVLALLGGGSPTMSLLIGRVPTEVEKAVPLGPIERVVGSLVRGDQGTLVAEVTSTPAQALASYRAFLADAGWREAETLGGDRGGFQPANRFMARPLCGEAHFVNPSTMGQDGHTYLIVRYGSRASGRNACDVEDLGPRMLARARALRLPPLGPPPGMEAFPAGAGSSSEAMDSRVTLRGDATPDEIFDHFAGQLVEVGWIPDTRTAADGVAFGRWRAQDEEGEPVVGVLAVWASVTPGTFTAWVRLERERSVM